jgi:hypothetical protein
MKRGPLKINGDYGNDVVDMQHEKGATGKYGDYGNDVVDIQHAKGAT